MEVLVQVMEGKAGINNILHNKDILAFNALLQVLEDPDHPGAFGRGPVAGYGHKVKGDGNRQIPGQIGQKEDRSLQYAD
jgi:hypothetical protein